MRSAEATGMPEGIAYATPQVYPALSLPSQTITSLSAKSNGSVPHPLGAYKPLGYKKDETEVTIFRTSFLVLA